MVRGEETPLAGTVYSVFMAPATDYSKPGVHPQTLLRGPASEGGQLCMLPEH